MFTLFVFYHIYYTEKESEKSELHTIPSRTHHLYSLFPLELVVGDTHNHLSPDNPPGEVELHMPVEDTMEVDSPGLAEGML